LISFFLVQIDNSYRRFRAARRLGSPIQGAGFYAIRITTPLHPAQADTDAREQHNHRGQHEHQASFSSAASMSAGFSFFFSRASGEGACWLPTAQTPPFNLFGHHHHRRGLLNLRRTILLAHNVREELLK
jgi:hypothetical protein